MLAALLYGRPAPKRAAPCGLPPHLLLQHPLQLQAALAQGLGLFGRRALPLAQGDQRRVGNGAALLGFGGARISGGQPVMQLLVLVDQLVPVVKVWIMGVDGLGGWMRSCSSWCLWTSWSLYTVNVWTVGVEVYRG